MIRNESGWLEEEQKQTGSNGKRGIEKQAGGGSKKLRELTPREDEEIAYFRDPEVKAAFSVRSDTSDTV